MTRPKYPHNQQLYELGSCKCSCHSGSQECSCGWLSLFPRQRTILKPTRNGKVTLFNRRPNGSLAAITNKVYGPINKTGVKPSETQTTISGTWN